MLQQLQAGISSDAYGHLFKKIGHFSIDDNMKSNLTTRELKSVYVDCSCQYLLLRMLKCHANS